MIASLRVGFERLLEILVILLMTGLSVVVLLGIAYRSAGAALVWYDEIASITLAWLTYYGAALAALKRAHIGVPNMLQAIPAGPRIILFVIAETLVIGFFVLVAWIAWHVLEILEGSTLVSLPWISEQVAQSVILIGAVLFIMAELLSLPAAWRSIIEPTWSSRPPPAEIAATE